MTSRSQKVKRIAIQCTSARTDFVTPEKSSIKAKHRFPASAIPIASHGRRSSLKTETRPPLTFSSQMNNPDTPSPRNEDAARVCHRWFVFKKNPEFFPPKDKHQKSFHPILPGTLPTLRHIVATSPRRWPERCRERSCPKHQSCCPSFQKSMRSRPSARPSSAGLMCSGSGTRHC